jgi:hypothetical protein
MSGGIVGSTPAAGRVVAFGGDHHGEVGAPPGRVDVATAGLGTSHGGAEPIDARSRQSMDLINWHAFVVVVATDGTPGFLPNPSHRTLCG